MDGQRQRVPGEARGGIRWWRRRRPNRMQAGLVVLSSAAIASVYAVGYVQTAVEEPANVLAAQAAATETPTAEPTPSPTLAPRINGSTGGQGTSRQPAARSAGGAVTPTPTASASPAAYRDGTYVGVGTSRHGDVQATVIVDGGRVVSAEITACRTRYPCTKVVSLPSRVIARQGATTDYVSGATDSSRAYMGAVANALAQAREA